MQVGEFSRRDMLKMSVVAAAGIGLSSCTPPNGPELADVPSGEYATEAWFQNQQVLWVPNGADGTRPVWGGIGDSSTLIYEDNDANSVVDAAFPAQRYETDTAQRPATSFRVLTNDQLVSGNFGFYLPAAYLEFKKRPYDGIILPGQGQLMALAGVELDLFSETDPSYIQAVKMVKDTKDLLAGLSDRAERTNRKIGVSWFAPVQYFVPGGALDPLVPLNGEAISTTADIMESIVGSTAVSPNVTVQVERTFADFIADEFVTGGSEQIEPYFAYGAGWSVRNHIAASRGQVYKDHVNLALSSLEERSSM